MGEKLSKQRKIVATKQLGSEAAKNLEGMKIGSSEGKPVNESSLSEISQVQRSNKSLPSCHPDLQSSDKNPLTFLSSKKAFTLSEILITLGIIGVVASLTLPSVIQNYKKMTVETKLKKAYTVMNQAIIKSETENSARENWVAELGSEEGLKKYILPYLKYTKFEYKSSYYHIYLADGIVLSKFSANYDDWIVYTSLPDKCTVMSKCKFTFRFNPLSTMYPERNFEPNMWGMNVPDENTLKNHNMFGCYSETGAKQYCAKLIQMNGWKIPDDYPIRF